MDLSMKRKAKDEQPIKPTHVDGERVILTAGYTVKEVPAFEEGDENLKLTEKAIEAGATVSKALQYGQVRVLVSNSSVDRHGESILIEGIDLTQIKRNPVLLWAHDYEGYRAPLGRIIKLQKSGGDLFADLEFDYDIYDFANLIYQQMLRGTVNAVSIGGLVIEWNDDYTVVKKLEMVELSVVPVGAHRDALVVAKAFDIEPEEYQAKLTAFIEKSVLDKYENVEDDELNNHIESLEQILATLKETRSQREPKETKETKKVKLITLKHVAGETAFHAGEINKIIRVKLKRN